MELELRCPEFADGDRLPDEVTCRGPGRRPALTWQGVPDGTGEMALTCVDPDAPGGTFVHWLVWGLDPVAGGIPEDLEAHGGREGENGFGKVGYGPPCPPPGDEPHRYVFHLYALADRLTITAGARIEEVHAHVEGRTLAEAELVGTYSRTD